LCLPPVGVDPARRVRRRILAAAAIPLLIVTANAAKTSLLVGHPYGTALFWDNLCVKMVSRLTRPEIQRLVDAGHLSNAADYRGASADIDPYGDLRIAHAPTGVPLLDLDRVPEGRGNAHALEHILIAERYYKRDALYLLSHYPKVYAGAVWDAVSTGYVSSAIDVDVLQDELNASRIEPVRAAVGRIMGRLADGRIVSLMVGLPLALVYGLARVLDRKAGRPGGRANRVALAWTLLVIGYEGAVTTLVSFGDMARYRFDVDALYWMLFALFLDDIARRVAGSLRARRGAHEA
jgi:uncharacterized membrane protein (UPF0136 family)